MPSKFNLVAGYVTLAVDAYLVLASIATRTMKAEYSRFLPPFGADDGTEPARLTVLLIATWTAILAIGCLNAGRARSDNGSAPGSLWFILVLGIVWCAYLTRVLKDVFAW